MTLAQPHRREQRAAPWHAAAIPGAAGLPEKAPDGYFWVGSDSPLAGCPGLHSTCHGRPLPCHRAPRKALLLSPSLSAPWTPRCSREAQAAPLHPATSSWGCMHLTAGLTCVPRVDRHGQDQWEQGTVTLSTPPGSLRCCAEFAPASILWGGWWLCEWAACS